VACKLTSPELQKRKNEVLKSLKLQVLERRELPNGYKYKFEGTDEIIDQVIAFIKSERTCCEFFEFSLSIADNKTHI
jgi:hypothetical protein